MARGKSQALRPVYSYLWRTSCLVLGGTTRCWLDDDTHLCTWSFGGMVNY